MGDKSAGIDVVDTLELSSDKKKSSANIQNAQVTLNYQKDLQKAQNMFFEEYLKIFLGIILVLLFVALFVGIVWYFLIQLDATLFDKLMGDTTAVSNSVHFIL